MYTRIVVGVCLVAFLVCPPLDGQDRAGKVLEELGGAKLVQGEAKDVKIQRGFNTVSRESSLRLEWLMVQDTSMGLTFEEAVGAYGVYDEPWFRYSVDLKMLANKTITAFEVRVVTFNVWHQFTGVLSFTQLEDLPPGKDKKFSRVWGLYGESRLRAHFTSIAYVAKVRLAGGETVVADPQLVLKAAQAIQSSVTLQDLEPKPEPVPGIGARS